MSTDVVTGARIAIIVVASICLLLLMYRAYRARILNGDQFTVWATAALVGGQILAIIVQANQIGRPLATWWGTPGFAIITLLCVVALTKSTVPWR